MARRSRAQALAKIRARWGQPVNRERKMEAIAESHRSRLSSMGFGASLRIHGVSQDLIRRALECAAILDAQRGTTLQGR